MPIKLSRTQIEQFQARGAICLRNVFSPDWIQKVATGIEKNLANPSLYAEKLQNTESSEDSTSVYFNDYCNWNTIPEFKDFVCNSPAAEIAGQLLDSRYAAIYHEHVLVKELGSTRQTPWHVDQSYYPIDGVKVCSIWMPIDPVGMDSTIQFVEESHLWPAWCIPRKFATSQNYASRVNITSDGDEANDDQKWFKDVPSTEELEASNFRIMQWEVEPGDCVVFHMKTLHGAPGNQSSGNRRRILSTRWLGDDAVIASRPWEVSPPTFGGLNIGDQAVSEEFPIIWTRN